MTWVLELPYPRAPKGLNANDRNHWRTKAASTAAVRAQVKAAAVTARITPMQRVQVELVWVVGDKRKRDPDNLAPFAKAICDAIGSDRGVSAHLVQDDSPEYMTKLHPRIEHRPDVTPHFEVHVTDISNRPDTIDAITRRLT